MGNPSVKSSNNKKMKEKMQEVEPSSLVDDSLVLNLSSTTTTTKNKLNKEIKFFNFLELGNSSNDGEKTKKKENNKRVYECKHCDRKFSSPQGVGGHQNAHKNNGKGLLKRERSEMDDNDDVIPYRSMGYGPPPLSPYPTFHLQGFGRYGYGGNHWFDRLVTRTAINPEYYYSNVGQNICDANRFPILGFNGGEPSFLGNPNLNVNLSSNGSGGSEEKTNNISENEHQNQTYNFF